MKSSDMAEATLQPKLLQFNGFVLHLGRSVLLRDGTELPLRRQSFDVLRCLAEHAGKVVSKEHLVATVWKVRPSDPNASLVQCIKDIRTALGDDARWMIRTVSGTGYEFTAEVGVAAAAEQQPDAGDIAPHPTQSEERPRFPLSAKVLLLPAAVLLLLVLLASMWRGAPTAEPGPLTMMAVPTLMFEPIEAIAKAHAEAAIHLGEQISQQLSRSPGGYELSVQVAATKGNKATIPSRYVLRGRVAGEASSREVVVHLLEQPSNRSIWSATFALGDDAGLAGVATQIARTTAVSIRSAEARRDLPSRPEASHYALIGRVILESERGPDVNLRAMAMFDKAIALDAKHVYALQGYARTRVAAVGNGWAAMEDWPRLMDEAERAVDRAIEVNQRGIGAHILRGVVERIKGNSERSLASLEHARQLNPNYPLVHAEIGRAKIDLGRFAEALSDIAHALKLSPMDDVGAIWCYWAGIAAAHLGDQEAVIDWMTKALQRNRAYKEPLPWLAIAYSRRGERGKAKALIDEYSPHNSQFAVALWLKLFPTSNKAVADQRADIARELLELGVPIDLSGSGSSQVAR